MRRTTLLYLLIVAASWAGQPLTATGEGSSSVFPEWENNPIAQRLHEITTYTEDSSGASHAYIPVTVFPNDDWGTHEAYLVISDGQEPSGMPVHPLSVHIPYDGATLMVPLNPDPNPKAPTIAIKARDEQIPKCAHIPVFTGRRIRLVNEHFGIKIPHMNLLVPILDPESSGVVGIEERYVVPELCKLLSQIDAIPDKKFSLQLPNIGTLIYTADGLQCIDTDKSPDPSNRTR